MPPREAGLPREVGEVRLHPQRWSFPSARRYFPDRNRFLASFHERVHTVGGGGPHRLLSPRPPGCSLRSGRVSPKTWPISREATPQSPFPGPALGRSPSPRPRLKGNQNRGPLLWLLQAGSGHFYLPGRRDAFSPSAPRPARTVPTVALGDQYFRTAPSMGDTTSWSACRGYDQEDFILSPCPRERLTARQCPPSWSGRAWALHLFHRLSSPVIPAAPSEAPDALSDLLG